MSVVLRVNASPQMIFFSRTNRIDFLNSSLQFFFEKMAISIIKNIKMSNKSVSKGMARDILNISA